MSFFTCLGTLSQSRSSSFNFSTLPMPGRGSNSAKDGRDQMIFSRYGGIGGSTQSISPPPFSPTHHHDFCFSSRQAAALPPTPRRRHRITASLPSPRRITASPRFPLVLPAGGGAGRATPEPPARYLFSHIFSVISFCQTD
ncbi:hypothetical protein OsJ_21124 [Oryza sativa Japonica Group]|uniref:Uncharacterized protein n=1 Tax=Oryza sativa subsp. japonica TaxID=39947 RepID=B9FSY3_ORYSJ|nr:hypothetical protein OsJ_21124 [Oryza sativa Japonica Group]